MLFLSIKLSSPPDATAAAAPLLPAQQPFHHTIPCCTLRCCLPSCLCGTSSPTACIAALAATSHTARAAVPAAAGDKSPCHNCLLPGLPLPLPLPPPACADTRCCCLLLLPSRRATALHPVPDAAAAAPEPLCPVQLVSGHMLLSNCDRWLSYCRRRLLPCHPHAVAAAALCLALTSTASSCTLTLCIATTATTSALATPCCFAVDAPAR